MVVVERGVRMEGFETNKQARGVQARGARPGQQ